MESFHIVDLTLPIVNGGSFFAPAKIKYITGTEIVIDGGNIIQEEKGGSHCPVI